MKKYILLVAIALICSVNNSIAQTVSVPFGDGLTWSLDISTATLTISGEGEMPDFNGFVNGENDVPWKNQSSLIANIEVESGITRIGSFAFFYLPNLSSVTLPESITSLGYEAFGSCISLTSLHIPNSVVLIDPNITSNCTSLSSIIVDEDHPTYITEDGILFNKTKTNLVYYPQGKAGATYGIPTSVTAIGKFAFAQQQNLFYINIPSTVTTIGERAFTECMNLVEATIPSSFVNFRSIFYNTPILEIEVTGGLEIPPYSFWNMTSLASIKIPSTVTTIGEGAFMGCSNLASIVIPDKVTVLADSVFYECTGLSSISIPQNITKVGKYAFYNCSKIKSLDIPSGVSLIEEFSFAGCGGLNENLIIPNSVTNIEKNAFYGCNNLYSASLSESMTKIEMEAFLMSSLQVINLSASITDFVFSDYFNAYSPLSDINVSENNMQYCSVDGVLYDKAQTSLICCPRVKSGNVTIPAGVTNIKSNSFLRTYLTVIDIPSSVSNLEKSSFLHAYPKTVIVHWTTPPSITKPSTYGYGYDHIVFGPTAFIDLKKITLIVPKGLLSVYNSANGWKDFNVVEEGGTGISTAEADDSPVISTQYYNLQGQEIIHPQQGQIYIAKELHQSGQTTVRKVVK